MANTFAHLELSTDDVAAAKKFYKKLFAWKIVDLPDGDYAMIEVGEKGAAGGGMQKKPMAEAPTAWLPYVRVDSVKRTLGQVAKNGGRVVQEHTPIGDMGAIGIFVDPAGATLGVWEEAKRAAPKRAPAKQPAAKQPAAKKPAAKKKAAKKKAAKKKAG